MFDLKLLAGFPRGGESIAVTTVLICIVAWLFSDLGYADTIMEQLLLLQLILSILAVGLSLVVVNDADGVYYFLVLVGALACSSAMSALYHYANDTWGIWVPSLTVTLLRVFRLLVDKSPLIKEGVLVYFNRS
jgi:hypothetical protein